MSENEFGKRSRVVRRLAAHAAVHCCPKALLLELFCEDKPVGGAVLTRVRAGAIQVAKYIAIVLIRYRYSPSLPHLYVVEQTQERKI